MRSGGALWGPAGGSDLIAHIKGVCRNAAHHNGALSGERHDEKKYLPVQNNEQQHPAGSRDRNGAFIKINRTKTNSPLFHRRQEVAVIRPKKKKKKKKCQSKQMCLNGLQDSVLWL